MSDNYIVIALVGTPPEVFFGCRIVREGDLYEMIYHRVFGPADLTACAAWRAKQCQSIPRWWDQEKEKALAASRSPKLQTAFLAARISRRVELAHFDGVPETKVEWEGSPIPYPVLYTRTSKLVAYAEFSGPDDLINRIWGQIANCAVGAAAAAGIALILGSPAAAVPAFKEAFIACIAGAAGGDVSEISVALGTEQQSGDWHRV